ncbi:hypothetical protein E8P82_01055 [Arthrobacter echini]|uniref:Uncharacterized protein n=1 Tax=Arthrobacter echini TaxID=1529066 RepID=A0A4S5EA54_9MICC|nr:DUF6480 family protein [Arthrobacter echini]THJ68534.1 hypothetical protein E8P82_01055 [Arthrobacter echini]
MTERHPDPSDSDAGHPDPEENNITGLEPGGGVPPGETPPAEASTTWDQGHTEDKTQSKGITAVWIGVVAVIVLLVLIFIVGNIVGLINLT